MVSTFQHPLYPYSGVDNPAAEHGQHPACRRAPAARSFAPPCASTGCRRSSATGRSSSSSRPVSTRTARIRSPGLEFADADYAWVTRELVAVAAKHAQGRIVSTLEGGYALSALGQERRGAHSRARHRVIRQHRRAAEAGAGFRGGVWSVESFWSPAWPCPAPLGLSALPAWAHATPRLYERARLVDIHGAPLKARALVAETNYIFHYPFVATPCFLLNLGRPAVPRDDAAPRGRNDLRLEAAAWVRRGRSSRSPRSARTSSRIRRATSRSSATSRGARRRPTRR